MVLRRFERLFVCKPMNLVLSVLFTVTQYQLSLNSIGTNNYIQKAKNIYLIFKSVFNYYSFLCKNYLRVLFCIIHNKQIREKQLISSSNIANLIHLKIVIHHNFATLQIIILLIILQLQIYVEEKVTMSCKKKIFLLTYLPNLS